MAPRKVHVAARSQDNPTYPQRFAVPDELVPWATPFPGYAPVPYTYKRGMEASYADPADPRSIPELKGRFTYEGSIALDPRTGSRHWSCRGVWSSRAYEGFETTFQNRKTVR